MARRYSKEIRETLELLRGTPISRREMIRRLGGGLGAVGLGSLLAEPAKAATRQPHFTPRAKRVIHLFMNGGPFGVDLFDPKPLIAKYEGQRPEAVQLRTERRTAGLMPSPFRCGPGGQSGVSVSQLLPETPRHIDAICVLRSVYTDNPNLAPALLLMNNGTISRTRPSMGSWCFYGLGSENE